MLTDRATTPPIEEMLQQFHGVKHMTSLDLTSAFLQIPLELSSRKYTAFLFDTNVYQFQSVFFRNEKFAGSVCARFEERPRK